MGQQQEDRDALAAAIARWRSLEGSIVESALKGRGRVLPHSSELEEYEVAIAYERDTQAFRAYHVLTLEKLRGPRLITPSEAPPQPPSSPAPGSELPQLTPCVDKRLPIWLRTELGAMGAVSERDFLGVRQNLDADEDAVRRYLGTYLPRTYVEARTIVAELMTDGQIRDLFGEQDELRILDIGCGTGGAALGAEAGLHQAGIPPARSAVTGIDGNQTALQAQARLFHAREKDRAAGNRRKYTSLTQVHATFSPDSASFVRELDQTVASNPGPYDLILVWKFLSEHYNADFFGASGIASGTAQLLRAHLRNPGGILIIADVTSKDSGLWLPEVLNREWSCLPGLEESTLTVAPVACACAPVEFVHGKCRTCYTQRIIPAEMFDGSRVDAKLTYRAWQCGAPKRPRLEDRTRQYLVSPASGGKLCGGIRLEARDKTIPTHCGWTGQSLETGT